MLVVFMLFDLAHITGLHPTILIYITTSLIGLFLLVDIGRYNLRSHASYWFWLTILVATISSLAQVIAVGSTSFHNYLLWHALSFQALSLFPPLVVLFSLMFVQKSHLIKRLAPVLLLANLGLLFVYSRTALIEDPNPAHATLSVWGHWAHVGRLAFLWLAYFGLEVLTSVLLMAHYYRATENPEKKREIRWIVL